LIFEFEAGAFGNSSAGLGGRLVFGHARGIGGLGNLPGG
jgi:hypothetical protein